MESVSCRGYIGFFINRDTCENFRIVSQGKNRYICSSTFNTDYILVKKENEIKALRSLGSAGCRILPADAQDEQSGL